MTGGDALAIGGRKHPHDCRPREENSKRVGERLFINL